VGVPILLGPIFGPIIGGLIVNNTSWQWIFVVNVPIAGAAILLAARVLRSDAGRVDAGKLDWLGAALLCPGLTGIVFGLSETETNGGITHLIAFGPIVAGVALVGLFIWHSLHVDRPLIDVRLFRSTAFSAAAATTFLLGAALFGTLLILPLYYQVDRGQSALSAGLLLAPQGIGAALMLPISGRLTDRIGGGPVVLGGCLLLAAATVPFMFVTRHTPYPLLAGVLFFRGVGLGASVQPSVAAAYQLLDSAQVPRATAALNTLRQIGGSIGTTVLAVILQHEGTTALSSLRSAPGGLLTPLPNAERIRLSGPVATAFDRTFLWALVIALLTVVPAAALIHAERTRRRQQTTTSLETAKSEPTVPQARAA
jgi:EmrB/QacA subfamily drug resistance transporter